MAEVATDTQQADAAQAVAQKAADDAAKAAPADGDKLLAGKFKTTEDLAKGYQELEKKLGEKSQKPGPMSIPRSSQDVQSVDQLMAMAGLDMAELGEQWVSNKALTDQQYVALAQQGYPRPMVDTFMQGQAAQATLVATQTEQIQEKAAALVGGKAQMDNLLAWAGNTLPDSQIAAMEARLQDINQWEGAMYELRARHDEAVGAGKAAPLIEGRSGQAGGAPITRNELSEVVAKAKQGDPVARTRISAMSHEDIIRLS